MLKKIVFGLILFTVFFSKAQVCKHLNLSEKFQFDLQFTRTVSEEENDICKIELTIVNKATNKIVQRITLNPEFIFSSDFDNCDAIKSFSTNFNTDREVADNDSGDFIVVDLNFDGLEDFAIKSDSGGNGGPTYSFFIQNEEGKFTEENYLTKTMEFFPLEIDKVKKRLTIYVHANAYQLSKTIFKYNAKRTQWKVIHSSLVDYDNVPSETEFK